MATLEDLKAISQKTGISMYGSGVVSQAGTQAIAPKPPKSNFFANAGKTLATVPGQVAGAIGSSIAKGFHDVAGGISEALTAGTQNTANEAYRKSIEDAGRKYHELYASGKLSKAAYTKLSGELINQSQSLSNEINGQVAEMVTPKDFATGLATVGSLPFAGGTLQGVAAGSKVATAARLLASSKATTAVKPIMQETLGSLAGSVAKAAIKYPLVTQPVATAPVQMAADLKHGDYGKAGVDAALLASPAIVGGIAKGAKVLAPIIKDAAFGKSAVLTDAFGHGKVQDFLSANPDKAAILKQMEQFTLNQPAVKGDAAKGAEFLASHLKSIGIDPQGPLDNVVSHFNEYAAQVGRLQGAIKAGKAPVGAVISSDFREAIPAVVKKIEGMGNADPHDLARAAVQELDKLGIQNGTVRNHLVEAILNGATPEELNGIAQKLVLDIKGAKLGKGFIATIGPKAQATMPSLKEAGAAGMPEIGRKAVPVLGSIASAADKVGLGFRDYNTKQIGLAKDAFTKAVNSRNINGVEGSSAYTTLSKLAEGKHLSDLRQLHVSEIAQALDISSSDARAVLGEAKKMYDGISKSVRGIAGKVQDLNQKFNPLAPGYARIQGKLRYDLNPAFRAQQKIEAATLGQVATGGHAPIGDVSQTVKMMRQDGFLPNKGEGFTGEALHDAGATNVTTILTKSEEDSLARVLQAYAAKNGTSKDMAENIKNELANEDTRRLMRAIVMNPKQGIMSSNFAKATNLLFFPSTYNAKVTGIALKALANQTPAVQFGVIKGINDFHDWSKTDAGIKWQSDNSEVLGLINYFTPINSIEQIYKTFSTGDVRQLGLIGGLPFGVISRIFEGQGIIPKTNPPYLDPKTGEVVPDKVPTTLKASVQTALGNIIDTMFTFPGRTAGLGSKTDLRNIVTGNVLKPASNGVKSTTRTDLTPEQLNQQRVLSSKPAAAKTMPAPVATRKLTVPTPQITPIYKGGALKAKKGKTLAKRPGTF